MLIRVIKILLILIPFLLEAQIIIAPSVYSSPPSGPSSTGYKLPTAASSTAESPYDNTDGAWATPQNIYGTGTSSITNNSWDSGELSHILRGYTFDFSSIPEGATIVGVMCRVVCSATASSTMNITLIQLLDDAGALAGTNLASTPIQITPQGGATLIIGAADNLWGNGLDLTWVQRTAFGVGLGVTSGTNNADVHIDSIELNIYYTVE